jgi:putative flippase GtrA
MIKRIIERLTTWEPMRKILNREMIAYLICGGFTFILSLGIYAVCSEWLGLGVAPSQAIMFVLAVLFAFFTNRYFVFQCKDWHVNVVLKEMLRFYGGRLIVSLAETALLELFVNNLGYPNMPCKIVTTVLVTISNYFISKLFIF